jgi:hypothetical protein
MTNDPGDREQPERNRPPDERKRDSEQQVQ